MAQGPILIFDKSLLQALNVDEAVWLDNFFLSNITPLFYIETLADLEKSVAKRRTPEQVVGSLAYKTPDLQSHPAIHHDTLLMGELAGVGEVIMDGRILMAGGTPVALDGKKGVFYSKTPEAEAFDRWGKHEFLDIERQIAKLWRRALTGLDHTKIYSALQWKFKGNKPKTLADVKVLVDADIDQSNQGKALELGMAVLEIPKDVQAHAITRWESAGKPPIRTFAPYFTHMASVDYFFYLGIAADLIGTERPAGKVDNKVDVAYLYYLPFCMVFASCDKLHARIVPLFLRNDQSFVDGHELKADLRRLDEHFARLPEEVRASGLFKFAGDPPDDNSFLVTRLWNKHFPPGWRQRRMLHEPLSKEASDALMEQINRLEKDGIPLAPSERVQPDAYDFAQVSRSIRAQKGKWVRVPPEAIK